MTFILDVYGHVTERMKQESAKRMEAFIKGIKPVKGKRGNGQTKNR